MPVPAGYRLAVGDFRDVWQATDLVLNRQVAVKILRSVPALIDRELERFRTGPGTQER